MKSKQLKLKGEGFRAQADAFCIPTHDVSLSISVPITIMTENLSAQTRRFKRVINDWWNDCISLSPNHFLCIVNEPEGYYGNKKINATIKIDVQVLLKGQVQKAGQWGDDIWPKKFVEEYEYLCLLIAEEAKNSSM